MWSSNCKEELLRLFLPTDLTEKMKLSWLHQRHNLTLYYILIVKVQSEARAQPPSEH